MAKKRKSPKKPPPAYTFTKNKRTDAYNIKAKGKTISGYVTKSPSPKKGKWFASTGYKRKGSSGAYGSTRIKAVQAAKTSARRDYGP